jgi:catechol 2,3-dioxygenase
MSTPVIHPDVQVGHVHLMVSDVDRSITFYRELLGFQVTYHSPDEPPYRVALLAAGDYHHHIALNSIMSQGGTPPPLGHTGLFHVGFQYPNREELARAVRLVHEHGHPFRRYLGTPMEWPFVAFDHHFSVSVYLQDPDGNGLELYYDRPRAGWERTASGMLRAENEERDVTELLPELLGEA